MMTLDQGLAGYAAENINNEHLTCLMIIYITLSVKNKTGLSPCVLFLYYTWLVKMCALH